ncbi:MAG: SDR family oxidoreductase, partial [Candidatus Spyradocola sp.]
FVTESIPLHRVGTPRENGEVVAFLASEHASYITGITVRVDGGLILPGMLEGHDKIPWVREEWKKDQYEKAMAMVKENAEKE